MFMNETDHKRLKRLFKAIAPVRSFRVSNFNNRDK